MKLTAETLENAILFACEKHKSQMRKGNGMPYITHPIAVMILLGSVKKSKNSILLAICCLLHDVVEDCDVLLTEIAEKFGHHVASIVSDLTSDKKEIERVGKETYLLDKMTKMSSYALCIKLADRLHNVSDLDGVENKANRIHETLFILNNLPRKRKLTKTHKTLIKMIKAKLKKLS